MTNDHPPFYAETLHELGVEDPLGGQTPADKALQAASLKWSLQMSALKAVSTAEMKVKPVLRKRAKSSGKAAG